MPVHNSNAYNRIPQMSGATPAEQSSVYDTFYGQMPIPESQFETSVTRMQSLEIEPSILTDSTNATVVNRRNRRNGIEYTAGRQSNKVETPQRLKDVPSSMFQDWLIGPQVNYILNACLYRAGYPAATISEGTDRNLALSMKVSALPSRPTNGPASSQMRPSPRFNRVQSIPRYSTMPASYPTAGTNT